MISVQTLSWNVTPTHFCTKLYHSHSITFWNSCYTTLTPSHSGTAATPLSLHHILEQLLHHSHSITFWNSCYTTLTPSHSGTAATPLPFCTQLRFHSILDPAGTPLTFCTQLRFHSITTHILHPAAVPFHSRPSWYTTLTPTHSAPSCYITHTF